MDNKYIKIIKGTPLFHGMSDEEIAQFLRPDGSGIKSFRKESYIFHAGDKTAYFGILLEGKALIERDELWGGRSIIAPLEAGQLFGEVYACTGEPLGVSVCAKEQCTVLFLSPESIIKESSTLTARLLKITAMKNLRLHHVPRKDTSDNPQDYQRACYGLSFFACKEKRIAHCHDKFRPSTACRFSLR